ncbi:hypothetical protein [Cellulosimicrobium sp. NPDC057862]|uniref:hypothetical protein n=1 Tax=Cellulosimicrobium sp. NPDC057862 TaxID=3346266 RepID=UPI00366F7057
MAEREPDPPSGWYESWLRDVAGGASVRTGPLFLGWVGLVSVVAAVVYDAGGRSEPAYMAPIGVVSLLYWALAAPAYVAKRYRGR